MSITIIAYDLDNPSNPQGQEILEYHTLNIM